MSGKTQAERDAEIEAAFNAYRDGRVTTGESGKPDRPKPIAEIYPLWEAMWEAFDFSWEGLADAGWDRGDDANQTQFLKRWQAPAGFPGQGDIIGEGDTAYRQSNLQEYWRWSVGLEGEEWLLTDPELESLGVFRAYQGKRYHIVHCPPRHQDALDDGSAEDDLRRTSQSDGAKFTGGEAADSSLLDRLINERLSMGMAPILDGGKALVDGRCQFQGLRDTAILTLWKNDTETGEALHLNAAMSNCSGVDLSGATLGDGANFSGATLGDGASFSRATLGDGASFFRATLGDGASFSEATLGDGASFSQATLGDGTSFSGATLGERASFSDATLGDGVSFSGATLGDGANFFRATLGERANFFRATLGKRADFSRATLGERANFSFATLGDGADFSRATLGERADFSEATLKGYASWAQALFKGHANFKDVKWNEETHYGGAFDSARFEDVANFKTTGFSAYAAFHDANFKQRLLLQPPEDGLRPEDMFATAERAATSKIKADEHALKQEDDETDKAFQTRKQAIADRIWAEVSGGYRTAKKAMEATGDFDREQTFYRFEVKARMKRPFVGMGEKLAAGFYNGLSDYGASIWRPFAGLLGFVVAFALVYTLLGVTLTGAQISGPVIGPPLSLNLQPADVTLQSFEFSMNNAFRPLSALSTSAPSDAIHNGKCDTCSLAENLLHNENGWTRLLVKSLAILQSLLSFILAFLFGLAIRRKFQIS